MYLNTINYGDGCYGIEAAAKNYFEGNATKEEAIDAFYTAVEEIYPELTH